MRYIGIAGELAYHDRYGGPSPLPRRMSDSEGDFRCDMAREAGLIDDQGGIDVPARVIEPAVQHHDCPTCRAVAGEYCRDLKLNPHSWNWVGTGFVREFAHDARGRDLVA